MTAAPRPAAGRGTILLLAAIAALGSLAIQLVVPALPQLARDLRSGADDAQLVIGVFLLGLAAGQLLAGPLADRLGRKPVLVAGLLLYCAASAAAAFAPSLALLLGARLAQALGGAAGLIVGRVLVGDLFAPEEAAARQATLMAVVLVSPALAPVLGGALSQLVGWRAIFLILAGVGLAGTALAALALPETRGRGRAGIAPTLAAAVRSLAGNRAFLAPAAAIAGGSSALYMFLGTAPFLLAEAHRLEPSAVGLCLMAVAGASIAGTFAVARLERRGDALLTGSALQFAGAALLAALAWAGSRGLPAFLVPTILLGLGAGMAGPAGITHVIRAAPGLEGTAASLAGAAQMLASALAAAALGRFAPVGAAELGIAATLATGVALTGALLRRRGHEPINRAGVG